MSSLEGRTALITGASQGIGRACAVALAKAGARVGLAARNEAKLNEVAAEIATFGGATAVFALDIASEESIKSCAKAAVAHFGTIEILVNNAGITRDKTLRKMTDDDWLTVLNTNLNACYFGVSAAMPMMIEQKYGRIINISSFVGQAGNFGQANYSASKGGIIAFTKTAAMELAKYNVTCNALAPGFTETGMLAKVAQTVQAQILARIPMGRFATPEEIAKAVLFLAADGDYITGQQINVNGGVYM
jgi:acetoacetyl-CoA reductase